MIGRYKQYTAKEDEMLKHFFHKHIKRFGARWYGNFHARIRDSMKNWGYDRTEKSISRRCFRLGLTAYKVKRGEEIFKCKDCKKAFVGFKRYFNRKKNVKKYCPDCAKEHKQDWNKEHRDEVLKYYSDYNKVWRARRRGQQIARRQKT